MAVRRDADHLERRAWREYLHATRDARPCPGEDHLVGVFRYEEVESWAWSRLESHLRQIARMRKRAAA